LLPLLVASVQDNIHWNAEVKQMGLLYKRVQNLTKKTKDEQSVLSLLPKFIALGEKAQTLAETTLAAQEKAFATLLSTELVFTTSYESKRIRESISATRNLITDLVRLNSEPLKYSTHVSYTQSQIRDLPYHYQTTLKYLGYHIRIASAYIQGIFQNQ